MSGSIPIGDHGMHLRLQLLRHAKSIKDESDIQDIDRQLSPRGQRAARAIGQAIVRSGFVPELVLCSPARRAADTWHAVSAELQQPPASKTVDLLYDFGDGSALLEAIRTHGGNVSVLMLVGHNPSMEELAKRLIADSAPELMHRLKDKFPTGALAVIEFSLQRWSDIAENTGTLTHFLRPADVTDQT